jgi:hypothetical protein
MMHPCAVSITRPVALLMLAAMLAGCGADAVASEDVPHSLAEPWQPIPFAVDQRLVTAADKACDGMGKPPGTTLRIIDARGANRLLLVYAGPKDELDCHVKVNAAGEATSDIGSGSGSSDPFPVPGPGQVENLSASSGGEGPDAVSSVVGQAGPGTGAVEVTLVDGRRVRASLGPSGWFAAWWPGGQSHTKVTAFDGAGTPTWSGQ